jgi:glycosyltransferase involved in cell wall biosynthesis
MGTPASASTDRPDQVDVLALIDHFVLGGAETLLARFALAAPRAGIRLSLACLREWDGNPAAAPLREAGIEPVNLNLIGRPGPSALRTVRRHIASVRPQVLHTHLGTSDMLGVFAARSLRIPAVSTIHTTKWAPGLDLAVGRVVYRCFDRVITVSDSARQEYLRRHIGRPERVVTIHNGIDVSSEPGTGAAVRRELGIAPDDFVITMVSALRPEKGHDVAIDAVRSLRSRLPNLRLLIAGQGDLRAEISARAADLGETVVLAGLRPDVMNLMDASDLCLQTSRREAFPTTIIEAMAAGVPVVATATGGIPEIISDRRLGVLIPAPPRAETAARAIASLIEQPGLRRDIAAAGRESYSRHFTAGPWLDRTRALYDQVLATRSTRAFARSMTPTGRHPHAQVQR